MAVHTPGGEASMLDGRPLIDAHVHAARLPTLTPAWRRWGEEFGSSHPWQDLYDAGGSLVPERVEAYFEDEGADALQVYRGLSVQPSPAGKD
ncbi:hypothetical protein [Actinomadura chokoriensis]|uniref:Amidohydrolase n=1 Tax=Actinomadura chokoriensis TaxID=454156 RepID=A0ABV4QZQ7_9ACTN